MNIDKILEAIPNMDAAQQKTQRENAEKHLNSTNFSMREAARRILTELDAQAAKMSVAAEKAKDAIREHARSLPLAHRIVNAFQTIEMTETDRKVVQALLNNPGASSPVLTKLLGWGNVAWQMHFGTMCRNREHLLGAAPYEAKRDDKFYTGLLCDYDHATSGFTLKPEAVAAFAQLGLAAKPKKQAI